MLKATAFGPVTRFDLARTLAGRGRYWTTCYLVDGLLIDSGPAHTAPELAQALDAALSGRPPARIVNTHTHEDHIGANGRLQQAQPGLEILAHPLALPVLADPRRRQPLHPYRRLFWGWPAPSAGKPLCDGDWVETDHFRFQAFYTPGHAPDHLCLYEPEQGWLFSGDLFVGGRDRAMRQGSDVRAIISSLKRAAALPLEWLFAGSARARQNPAADLAAKIELYEALGEQVLGLHRQGLPEAEIIRRVCGGPMWIEFVTLGHFARKWLVRSYLVGTL